MVFILTFMLLWQNRMVLRDYQTFQKDKVFIVKIALSFFLGVVFCILLLVGMKAVAPLRASSEDLSSGSDNLSIGLIDLLPDLEKIYREALVTPLLEAKKKIYDEDIAQFYDTLLEKSDLNTVEEKTQ